MVEKCPNYLNGNAKKEYFLGTEVVLCTTKKCPYDNNLEITFELEPITICETKGLIEKIDILSGTNPPILRFKR